MIQISQLRARSVTIAVSALLASAVVESSPIVFVRSEYNVVAWTQAFTEVDKESFRDVSTASSLSIGALANSTFIDGDSGYNSAYATGSASWSFSANSMSGGVGGLADAYSESQETAASGFGSLQLYFDVTQDVSVNLVYEGTYDSQLRRLEDGHWVQVDSWMGWDDFRLPQGSYRWDGAAGEYVTGTNSYSSGMFFTLTANTVAELPVWGSLVAGLILLAALQSRITAS